MANTNDEKILTLKKQIEEKKLKLGKVLKFTPVTNLSLELDGVRTNINTLQKDQTITLMVKLNALAMSAKDLDVHDAYSISGFNVMEWITDLKSRYEILTRKDEEQKLKAMEAKLDQLLSDEKKVELELSDIENMLKD